MSYEIIKHITVDEKQNKVYINGASNNVYPRYYEKFESSSLSNILEEQGRLALDVEILRAYESGNFQKGSNRYTKALKVLNNMDEYKHFDWRNNFSFKSIESKVVEENRKSQDFEKLLEKAIKTKLPKPEFYAEKTNFGKPCYLKKITKRSAIWTYDFSKKKLFHYEYEIRNLKSYYQNSEDWQIKKVTTESGVNLCNKTRKVDNPYEVWQNKRVGWEWRVLKKYQTPLKEANNPYARWFCAVKSPMTYDSWEYGDTYINDIKNVAVRVK